MLRENLSNTLNRIHVRILCTNAITPSLDNTVCDFWIREIESSSILHLGVDWLKHIRLHH